MIGGGIVAERKVVSMLVSGGKVTVISPNATDLINHLADLGDISWLKRDFQQGDAINYFLVCAATDDNNINTAVYQEAYENYNIRLVNVVDIIPQCTYAAASVVTNGETMISISTSGKSPATSRRIREHFEELLSASSLYTLGYENENPTSIENQNLPYPVYFLLENRNCILIYDEISDELMQRRNLLVKCGANVVSISTKMAKEADFTDAFLLISDEKLVNSDLVENIGVLYEYVNTPNCGSFYTPKTIINGDMIISMSTKNHHDTNITKDLYNRISKQFTNNGYGKFINFLGEIRPEVLSRLNTSKERATFFDNLINYVEKNSDSNNPKCQEILEKEQESKKCCLRLTDKNCKNECLYNWISHGKIQQVHKLVEYFLNSK
ncbi:bifunctional precorrin-2 dehydrogenase/sirohydrochlorin ferrochelatase [Candidatus Poribacteria bacterium]|nr:bifunctional precorrin-2 dehydrogenase/sirohydrochlorin ferrochelatase [Candidatus Poribacteria bacterium]